MKFLKLNPSALQLEIYPMEIKIKSRVKVLQKCVHSFFPCNLMEQYRQYASDLLRCNYLQLKFKQVVCILNRILTLISNS